MTKQKQNKVFEFWLLSVVFPPFLDDDLLDNNKKMLVLHNIVCILVCEDLKRGKFSLQLVSVCFKLLCEYAL